MARTRAAINWTEEMDAVVRTISSRPAQEIADELGVSREAVYSRKRKLGLTGRPRGGRTVQRLDIWETPEIDLLRELAPTTSHAAIAKMIDRSEQAVSTKASQLGISGRPKNFLRGSQHGNWRGGNSTNYGREWNTVVVPQVYERDGYHCQEPGCDVFSPSGRLIHAHHIVPRRLTWNGESHDDRLENHVTLCDPHHRRQAAHRWKDVTPDLIETLPGYQRLILEGA